MPDSPATLISRGESSYRFTSWRSEAGTWLFNLGLLAFFGTVAVAGALFFYAQSLGDARADWEKQVKTEEAELRPELLDQLVDLSNALAVTKDLLSRHVYSRNALTFLEEVTLPRVQFTSYSFAVDAQKIDLAGLAASYEAVSEQVRILESHPQVESVNFGGLSKSGERALVAFKLAITFRPSLIQPEPEREEGSESSNP